MQSQAQAQTEIHPVLPAGMQRENVTQIFLKISAALGLTPAQLKILQLMIGATRPADWVDPEVEPVCFAMQETIANNAGLDVRSVRRTEHVLVRLGLASKDVSGNGRRGCHRWGDGREFRQGINFTPMIEAMPQLQALFHQIEDELISVRVLRQKISSGRRQVKELLMELQPRLPRCPDLKALSDIFLAWPSRIPASTPLDQLEELFGEVMDAVDRLGAIRLAQTSESGRPDSEVRPYIQDTNNDSIVSCTAPAGKRTAGKPADSEYNTASPNGEAGCLEKSVSGRGREIKPEFLAQLTPERLLSLCSAEMHQKVLASQGRNEHPDQRDFVNAAIDRLVPLGISPSAWDDATDQMGDFSAALCVLILDRNRFHPETPVRVPGGALRAMTRRHAAGALDLLPSLFGLSKRDLGQ